MRTRHTQQQQPDNLRGGAVRVPRRRGAFSGLLLVLLGAWGALAPFIGPGFDFAYSPDNSWTWTAARGWYEVLPGVAVAVAGLLLMLSRNRITAVLSAWLAVAGGAWFIAGPQVAPLLRLGAIGTPTASGNRLRVLESLAYFAGLGAVILFFAAAAFGRLSVRSVADVKAARRREADAEVDDNAGATDTPDADATNDDTVNDDAANDGATSNDRVNDNGADTPNRPPTAASTSYAPTTYTATNDGTGAQRDDHPAGAAPKASAPTGAHAMATDDEATAEHAQRA
jgi:hypothetical protein